MKRSYVRIYGPPHMEAIKALEAVAVELSKSTQVKFSHKCLPYPSINQPTTNDWNAYLKNMSNMYVDCYEPLKIISEAHTMLGEYDFFYEWVKDPTMKQVRDLMEKIDEALDGLGCYYTLTTK
ncbi:MAG: hypothetical protein PVJ38_03975 [Candidatus Bathyarchaeota archaeon]|jgi:hypothetical protein